jgi:hypothetical protein
MNGAYAYGPVNLAGYYAPAPVEGFIFLLILVAIVLLIWWWVRRRTQVDSFNQETITTTNHTHNIDPGEDRW